MPRLSITTQRPTMEIHTTPAKMVITSNPRKFTIKSSPPRMRLDSKMPSFKVNKAKVMAERGLPYPRQEAVSRTEKGNQSTLNAIGKIASEGDYVGSLENYVNTDTVPYAEIAKQNNLSDIPELNIASVPSSLPEIEWDDGYMNISWDDGSFDIEWDKDFWPEVSVSRHSVEIRVGKSKVKITVDEDSVPKDGGKQVDVKL